MTIDGGGAAGLTALIDQLPAEPHHRGAAFEALCEWYLLNEPVFRGQLRRVWRWRDWPARWGPDAGIDLVAETRTGDLWAIQAKAFSAVYSLKKTDIDSFLAEAGRFPFVYRLILATTDLCGTTARAVIDSQMTPTHLHSLGDLLAATVDWPENLAQLASAPRAPLRPRTHQREALDAVVSHLASGGRGQLVMACGTGKTLVGRWVHDALASALTVVVVPSLSLVAQTMREWFEAGDPPLTLLVCSDETVASRAGADQWHQRINALQGPATTDLEEVKAFLARIEPRVVFVTYQSLAVVAAAVRDTSSVVDLIVVDEAHRCAGVEGGTFGQVLDASFLPAQRRLFMTATPRVFAASKSAADVQVVSMDDESAFGPVIHRLSFSQAIGRRILADYRVVIGVLDNPSYRHHLREGRRVRFGSGAPRSINDVATEIWLAKAIRRFGLRRVVTFHSRVRRAAGFAENFPKTCETLPEDERPAASLWAEHVSGEMPVGRREQVLDRLRSLWRTECAVVSNAQCLAEGVDVPALDAIAFVDPRRSDVDIIQAVGRVMRRVDGKTEGVVLIPVFVPAGDGGSSQLALSSFSGVWAVLRALRAHDDRLALQLDTIRRNLGSGEPWQWPDQVEFDVPLSLGENFVRQIEIAAVERSTEGFEFWYGVLQRFVELHGHARVPSAYMDDDRALGAWVNSARVEYTRMRAGRPMKGWRLTEAHVTQLEALPGWTWDARQDEWELRYRLLHQFVDREGHALVPQSHEEDGVALGKWVNNQRRFRREGRLSESRQLRLESVRGWEWNVTGATWDDHFDALKRHVAEGHRIPTAQAELIQGLRLGRWVANQRRVFRDGRMTGDRAAALTSIPGWTWGRSANGEHRTRSAAAATWERHYRELLQYIDAHGTARVPQQYFTQDGFGLGNWVALQRKYRRRGTIPAERIEALEALPGWTWAIHEDQWVNAYEILLRHVAEHGTSDPGTAAANYGGFSLYRWVAAQRIERRRGRLSQERQELLARLPGWRW